MERLQAAKPEAVRRTLRLLSEDAEKP